MTFDLAEARAALERGPSVLRALTDGLPLEALASHYVTEVGPWRSMLGVLDRVDR